MSNMYPKKPAAGDVFLTVQLADISAESQMYVAPGFAGRIRSASYALNGAITGADATLTLKIGGAAVTGGAIVVPYDGSAAGDVGSWTPSGANTFTSADAIEVESNGGSSTTAAVTVTLHLETV